MPINEPGRCGLPLGKRGLLKVGVARKICGALRARYRLEPPFINSWIRYCTATRRGAMSVSPGEEVISAAISYSLVQSNVQGKPEQELALKIVLRGTDRVVILPTGNGKSIGSYASPQGVRIRSMTTGGFSCDCRS